MNRKQKTILIRILLTAVLTLALHPLPVEGWARLLLTLIPYLLIGWDILRKAVLGIFHREVFDENFLMSIATIGALVLGQYEESVEGDALLSNRRAGFRAMPSEKSPPQHCFPDGYPP